jgi:hypothetical protein
MKRPEWVLDEHLAYLDRLGKEGKDRAQMRTDILCDFPFLAWRQVEKLITYWESINGRSSESG